MHFFIILYSQVAYVVILGIQQLMLFSLPFQTVQAGCLSGRDRMGPERREAWSRQQKSSSLMCGGGNKKKISITKWTICRVQRIRGCITVILDV